LERNKQGAKMMNLNRRQIQVYKRFLASIEGKYESLVIDIAALKNVLGDFPELEDAQGKADEAGDSLDHIQQMLDEVAERLDELDLAIIEETPKGKI